MACGILARSPNHRTAREFPISSKFNLRVLCVELCLQQTMNTHFEQVVPSISWGKRVPGQTADAPRWTDAQYVRCPTQLPRPWDSLIRKGYDIRAQLPPFSGHRGRASLNSYPRVQPPTWVPFL